MYLIEILLPTSNNEGQRFEAAVFDRTQHELIDRFGGLTAFFRSPASGVWEAPDGSVQHDSIVVLEVMSETLDRTWWSDYRTRLEKRFSQDEIVLRAHSIDLIRQRGERNA